MYHEKDYKEVSLQVLDLLDLLDLVGRGHIKNPVINPKLLQRRRLDNYNCICEEGR